MISKVENSLISPSLNTLVNLANGLDVPLSSLFRGTDQGREAVFTPAGTGQVITGGGERVRHSYEYRVLGALRGEHRRVEPILVAIAAREETYPVFNHAGTEFVHMLTGEMDYRYGNELYRMGPGDSILFDAEGIHGPVGLIELPVRFLVVTAYPDES